MNGKHLTFVSCICGIALAIATLIYLQKLHQEKTNADIFAGVLAEAKTGEISAVWVFSTCLSRTNGKSDEAEVLQWLIRVSNDGDHHAETAISSYYFTTGNHDLGLSWLIRAAHNGNPVAQLSMGDAYEKGSQLVADSNIARTWYERAANNHNAEAQYRLARFYIEGLSVTKDLDKAEKLMNAAASNGSIPAQKWLNQQKPK